MNRKPEILGIATFDQHHGVRLGVVFHGLRGEPVETMWITPKRALELAESLVRSAKQAWPAVPSETE